MNHMNKDHCGYQNVLILVSDTDHRVNHFKKNQWANSYNDQYQLKTIKKELYVHQNVLTHMELSTVEVIPWKINGQTPIVPNTKLIRWRERALHSSKCVGPFGSYVPYGGTLATKIIGSKYYSAPSQLNWMKIKHWFHQKNSPHVVATYHRGGLLKKQMKNKIL